MRPSGRTPISQLLSNFLATGSSDHFNPVIKSMKFPLANTNIAMRQDNIGAKISCSGFKDRRLIALRKLALSAVLEFPIHQKPRLSSIRLARESAHTETSARR